MEPRAPRRPAAMLAPSWINPVSPKRPVKGASPLQHQILVPLDGSAVAATVLPHAALLALATGSGLALLRVIPSLAGDDPLARTLVPAIRLDAAGEQISSAARAGLNAAAEDLEEQGLAVQTEVIEGAPAQVITGYAAAQPEVQTIALATHGWSGLRRWLLGSITETVVHTAPCSLLLVRPTMHGDTPQAPPTHHSILVPLDGSVLAERALRQARSLAQHTHAQVILLGWFLPSIPRSTRSSRLPPPSPRSRRPVSTCPVTSSAWPGAGKCPRCPWKST